MKWSTKNTDIEVAFYFHCFVNVKFFCRKNAKGERYAV